MKTSTEILDEIRAIFSARWNRRDGRKVPEPEEVKLGNDAVLLDGTVLYADMRDSTGLVSGFKDWFAAEIYKSYLVAACHVIRNHSGNITAFDGDRVMAVFTGDTKNSSAARAALQINFIVRQINAALKKAYPNTAYVLNHVVGIDTSSLLVARTGIRNSNDLVWVGRAANYAAKLCDLTTDGYPLFITDAVFKKLSDNAKFGGNPKQNMWDKVIWEERGVPIYGSRWWWEF